VTQKLHPGPHPDADQLCIFVEGADTSGEHQQVLAHLAECDECRDTVFLMQRSVETLSPATEVSKGWVWQRWLLPASLAGAALAVVIALLVYVRPGNKVPAGIQQSAALEQHETGQLGPPLVPSENPGQSEQREKAKKGLNLGQTATSTARQEPGTAAESKVTNGGSNPAKDTSNPGSDTQLTIQSTEAIPSESAAPKPATQPGSEINSTVVQQLPLNGRNFESLPPPPSQPHAQAATQQDGLETQQNLPALRVERSGGQDETLSGVSGRVTDMSGGVIPQATVALRDASGSTRQIATDGDGSFRLTGMPAGHYDLTVTARGFKSSQQPIDLKPSQMAMLQPVLAPGETSQTVMVTESAPLVETTSSSLASTIEELPIPLPGATSVSLGKQTLSLGSDGNLFVSRNKGKSWKKVHPQWSGKAVRVNLTSPDGDIAGRTTETSGSQSNQSLFQLTTESGAQWTSKDGTHWRQK
jgi:hypothetical protein